MKTRTTSAATGVDSDRWETDRFFEVDDGVTLRYRLAGHGDIGLVFVPGWTMSCEVFSHQLSHYADSPDYQALSYDPRSQGRSSQTSDGHFYEQHARDLHRLIARVGLRRIVLVGWSAGGTEVLEYLRVFGTASVVGVVIVDIPPKVRGGDNRVDWVDFGTVDNGDQDDALRSFTFDLHVDRPSFNREFSEWMLDDPTEGSVRFFSEMSNQTPSLVATQLIMSMVSVDDTAVAENLDGVVPVLYYIREDWQEQACNWIAHHASHAEVIIHGKHAMFWEHSARFNEALDDFLVRRVATHAG